ANQTSSITPPGGAALPMTYTDAGQSKRTQAGGTRFVNDAAGIAVITNAGSSTYLSWAGGTVLSERLATGTYYYLHDGLQSVVAVTDSTGAVVDSYSYDPYGNSTAATEPVPNSLRWIGAVWDSSTQLYKMGARYYSP